MPRTNTAAMLQCEHKNRSLLDRGSAESKPLSWRGHANGALSLSSAQGGAAYSSRPVRTAPRGELCAATCSQRREPRCRLLAHRDSWRGAAICLEVEVKADFRIDGVTQRLVTARRLDRQEYALHSCQGPGEHQQVDINALVEDSLNDRLGPVARRRWRAPPPAPSSAKNSGAERLGLRDRKNEMSVGQRC